MAELSMDQKRAIALASARLRIQQQRGNPRADGAAASAIPGDASMSGGRTEAALIGARQGVTFGFGDEINAGVRAAGDWLGGKPFGEAYDARLAHERALLDQVRQENPVASTAGEIAGAAIVPMGAVGGGTLAAQAGRGAIAGGLAGGLYGFGDGEGGAVDRTQNALAGGATGAVIGAIAPVVLNKVAAASARKATGRAMQEAADAAPTEQALRNESARLYDAARARGVEVKPAVVQGFAADVARTAADEGLDPVLTPRAYRAVERITAIGESGQVKWKDLELARRVAGIAAQSADPNERRMAGIVTEKVDDFILGMVDGDLTAGSAQGLGSEISEARKLWGQMRTSERMTQAMEKAKDAASGYENGLRIEFRKLVNDKKFWRGLSGDEKDAVLAVVRGSATGNILKRVSRLSFGAGAQTNFLGASVGSGLGATAGSTIGGPVGALIGATVPPLVGRAAAKGAERATERAAMTAQGLAAAGGLSANVQPANLMLLENALARAALPSAVSVNALSRER